MGRETGRARDREEEEARLLVKSERPYLLLRNHDCFRDLLRFPTFLEGRFGSLVASVLNHRVPSRDDVMAYLTNALAAMMDCTTGNMLVNNACHHARSLDRHDLLMLMDNIDRSGYLRDPLDSNLHRLLHSDVVGGHLVDCLHDCVGHLPCLSIIINRACYLPWNLLSDRDLLSNNLHNTMAWD